MITAVLALLLQVHPITVQPSNIGTPDVTLPSATIGVPFYTVKVLPGAATTTVRASGAETVDGSKTFSISAGGAVTFRAISGAWYVVGAYSTAVAGSGTPAGSVVTETAFAQASAVGASTDYARADHTHGTPTIADADVPNTITIDLATLATTATTANAGDSATAFFPAGVIEVVRGGTGATPGADDQVLIADSAAAATWRAIGNCVDASGQHLNYTTATNTWSCGTTSSGAPATATYWTAGADIVLTSEKDLSALATGLVLNTAGVPSTKAANTCTNQFPRSDTASGVWTCADVTLTTDTAGNYVASVATGLGLTGGAAGSEGAAITVSKDYSQTLAGNPALNVEECVDSVDGAGAGGKLCEGTTADGNEILWLYPSIADTGADVTRYMSPITLVQTGTVSDALVAGYTALTGITFTPAANGRYLMDCFVRYTTTAATTGISLAWDVPAGVTSIFGYGTTMTVAATGVMEALIQRADNVASSTFTSVITVENVMYFHAQLVNGATSTATTLGITPEVASSVSAIAGSTCTVTQY